MTADIILFWMFAAVVLGSALMTILTRNAVHSAVWLIASLLGTAGLFLLQKAEFLFAVQIILYIGGIMLLFLFVIMLVNLDRYAAERQFNGRWWAAAVCVTVTAAEGVWLLRHGASQLPLPADETQGLLGNTERLADLLFTQYLVPFELASLLLLVAVVGSVLLARTPKT